MSLLNIRDFASWHGPDLATVIRTLRALIAEETDEIMLQHLRIELVAAREELAKRNASEIARRMS